MPDRLDLVQGANAIGQLFDPPLNGRQVQYLASTTPLPVFKFNGRLSTTVSAMQQYFAKLASEALARGPRGVPGNGETAPEERHPVKAAEAAPPPLERSSRAVGQSLRAAPSETPSPRRKPRRRPRRPPPANRTQDAPKATPAIPAKKGSKPEPLHRDRPGRYLPAER